MDAPENSITRHPASIFGRSAFPALQTLLEKYQPARGGSPRPRFYFDDSIFASIEQLLDIGGGPGLMASLLKAGHPHLKITVFDLPHLCEEAHELFRAKGQQDDLGVHPGHFLEEPLPSGFEAIQFCGILDALPAAQSLVMLRKARQALPRYGRLLVLGRPTQPYAQWLHAVGMRLVKYRQGPGQQALWIAVR